jgi:hypothetical protein
MLGATGALPDRAPLAGLADHLRPLGAAKCLLKLRHVLHGPVHPERTLGVRIGQRIARLRLQRLVLGPHLCETEEETLLRREAIDDFALLSLQRFLVRPQRQRRAAFRPKASKRPSAPDARGDRRSYTRRLASTITFSPANTAKNARARPNSASANIPKMIVR